MEDAPLKISMCASGVEKASKCMRTNAGDVLKAVILVLMAHVPIVSLATKEQKERINLFARINASCLARSVVREVVLLVSMDMM